MSDDQKRSVRVSRSFDGGGSIAARPFDVSVIRGLVATHAPEFTEKLDQAADSASRATVLLDAARRAEFTSRSSAVRLAEASVDLALAADEAELIVSAQLLLAFQLNETNRSLEAFQHALEAIAVARTFRQDNISPYLRSLSTRALIRGTVGDLAGARRDYQAILDVPLERTDMVTLVVARLNLSSMYIESQRPARALHHLSIVEEQLSCVDITEGEEPGELTAEKRSYFRVALEQNRASASIQLADALVGKGRRQQIPGLLDSVLRSCRRVSETIEPHDRFNVMLVHTLRSGAHRINSDFDRAIAESSAAVVIAHELGQSVYPQPHIAQALAFDAAHRWPEAITAWAAADAIARRAGASTLIGYILDHLAGVHEQLGDLVESLRLTRQSLEHSRQVMDQVDQLAELEHDTTALDGPPADDETSWRERLWVAERQASLDPLTGVLNRRGLALKLADAAPSDSERSRLVALVDIDHFKQINDQHSHLIGDDVLRTVARILDDSVPPQAMVARYGGEEFAIVLDGCDHDSASAALDVVREAVQRSDWSHVTAPVTVSIGFAFQGDSEFTDVLAAADAALYEAKRSGRNVVCSG